MDYRGLWSGQVGGRRASTRHLLHAAGTRVVLPERSATHVSHTMPSSMTTARGRERSVRVPDGLAEGDEEARSPAAVAGQRTGGTVRLTGSGSSGGSGATGDPDRPPLAAPLDPASTSSVRKRGIHPV